METLINSEISSLSFRMVVRLVIGTGNPQVIRDLPGPVPKKTRTLA